MKANIIINTVNEKDIYLRKAIESYLKQKNVDIEIIISTIQGDKSISIGVEYGASIAVSPKKGIYQQLNNSLKYIDADYFAYASGNDVALINKMEIEIELCESHNKKVCYSDFIKANKNLVKKSVARFIPYNYKKHLQGNFVNDCATIHSSLLKYTPFELKWGNDAFYDYWLRVYENEGDVFIHNDIPTWVYRITNESQHVRARKCESEKKRRSDIRNKMIKSRL